MTTWTSARRRLAAVVLTALFVAAAIAPATAVAHGPDPVLGGALFGQDQALTFDWRSGSTPPDAIRVAIKAAAADVNATKASRAATFSGEGRRVEPDRLRPRRDVRRERHRLLLAERPDRLLDVVPRAGSRLRLGDDEVVPAVRIATERLLRRRDRRARRVRARRRARSPRQRVRRRRLPRCRRPDLLACQAGGRLEHAPVRGLRRRDPPARVRRPRQHDEDLDVPGSGHRR